MSSFFGDRGSSSSRTIRVDTLQFVALRGFGLGIGDEFDMESADGP